MANKSKLDEPFLDIPPNRRKKFIHRALRLMDSAVASPRVSDSARDIAAVGPDSLRALQIIADLCGRAGADEEAALRIMKAVKGLSPFDQPNNRYSPTSW